jgi:hypothetical protein
MLMVTRCKKIRLSMCRAYSVYLACGNDSLKPETMLVFRENVYVIVFVVVVVVVMIMIQRTSLA